MTYVRVVGDGLIHSEGRDGWTACRGRKQKWTEILTEAQVEQAVAQSTESVVGRDPGCGLCGLRLLPPSPRHVVDLGFGVRD